MSRWRRRRSRIEELDADEAFELAVRDVAQKLNAGILRYDRAGEVQLSGMWLAGTVDLRNVRQLCLQVPREEWTGVVWEHLAGLGSVQARPRAPRDFDETRPLLRARLYGEAEFLLSDVAARPVAPGVVEALVVADEGVIATVARSVADGWPEPLEDLLALGRDQVRAEGPVEPRLVDVDGAVLTALEAASFFTTTHVFWLDEYTALPPDGALVALPNRHLLLVHPLRDATVLDAAEAMLVNAHRFHEEGPGSLSPHLYWWRDGGLTLLPAVVEPDRVEFRPPAEFVEAMRRIGA